MNIQARRDYFDLPRQGEAGYSWLYWASPVNSGFRVLVTVLVIALASILFAWYSHTNADTAPDSVLGLLYAILGTLLIGLAIVMYSLRKRSSHHREVGGLRASLGWHMCFAIMGLAILCMHSFGEFNPRSGTYALYAMVALVISGLVGRVLDRLMPRLIAGEAHQAMTAQGDDRIETLSQKLQAIVVYNAQDVRGVAEPQNRGNSPVPVPHGRATTARDQTLHTPWDLGYVSLGETPQELSQVTGQFSALSEKRGRFFQPGALIPGTQEHMVELDEVRRAMQRELFYRYIIRYWRKFHILLSLVTVGLVIWHIVYALQLIIPTVFH
ncbi:MAG TPA: hypothetical protein VKV19_05790 [Ktedonobacteraceae bacterium]|nr:hypothetical protein [Ktedonobacteraceae bacterium]